jgi:hypothetical protein
MAGDLDHPGVDEWLILKLILNRVDWIKLAQDRDQ